MDLTAQNPESPARPLAGAARARVLARQSRNSSHKPYARPSSALTASGSGSSLYTDTDSPARTPSTPAAKTPAPQPSRSAFSPLRVAATPIALFGSVRKMVTKPLSWLTGVAASTGPELGIPTSSSTNSLSSIARKRAAAQASLKSTPGETSYERDAPTRAARAVGERLAAGLRSRSNLQDDEESQIRPPTSTLPSSMSMSRLAPGPAPARSTRKQSSLEQADSSMAGPSSPSKSTTSVGATHPWSTRSSKRTLDIGSRPLGANDSSDAQSDAGLASPSRSQLYLSKSQHTLRSPRSQALGYRGSSLRPDDAMSESGSTSMSHSNSFSAFGYGNEIRYTDSAFGLPPSSSPFQLSSRNAASRRARAPFASGLITETGTPGRASRAGSVSMRGASPAPSAGYSPARQREGTPQRRNWNGLNLAAPSAPSMGDEMMREYLASRTLPGSISSARRNLALSNDEPMIRSASVAGGSRMDDTESVTPSRLGKRDIDMSVDGHSERLGAAGTPSKRRMVWHKDHGFISHEELKALEPRLPSPKNEAERLLNALETMRKPTATSRGVGLARGAAAQINVPAPISDAPASRSTKSQDGKPIIGVAPYTRYLRKAKTVQAADEQGGMRARLKKVQRPSRMDVDDAATEDLAASDAEEAEQDVEDEREEDEEEEEEEPAPPQPEPVRRSRRLQHQAPATEEVTQTPRKQADVPARAPQLKSALKATPLRASAQPRATPAKAVAETPKPASHRIPLSAASKAPASTVKKDNFAVKASTGDASAPRERSSLRQGAAKTSRTHQSSGKFSAWDEDEEEEDLPDASELAKIKLPTNMFPSGFSFGSSAAAPSTTSAPASKSAAASAPASQAAGGNSLLGRLGGFDSSAATASASEEKEAPKAAATAPSFSFSASTQGAGDKTPKFSFGASTAFKQDDNAAKKPAAPSTSDFFSKPAEAASTSLSEGKKDGPVPNFFGSTMKKFESKSGDANAPAASTPSGGFSFGSTTSSTASGSDAAASKPAPFSFGAKPAAEPTSASAPAKNPFGSFSASSEKKDESAPASKPSFFSGASSSSSSAGGFSFGAPSASAASTGSKRGADDDAEPAAKKSMPSFSFGAPAASQPATQTSSPASSGFSFGTPSAAAAEKKDDASTAKPSSGVPNFFGAKGEDASKPAAPASTGGFTFGKPSTESSASSSGFGAPKPADAASSSTGFSFGAPKSGTEASKPAGGFTFGAPSSTGSSPAPETKPAAASATTFSFGVPKPASSDTPASSAPASGTTTPNGTFTFGASTNASKPASSGFTFGAPASSTPAAGSSGGFGGFGTPSAPASGANGGEMMDDSPQKTAPATTTTPSFTFGSSTPAKSATPAPFTFGASAPAANTGSASPSTFTFGASAPASNTSSGAAAGAGGFRFGSPAPAGPAPAATSFTFGAPTGSTTPGVGSTPASPFLAPAAPVTPGGSPFQFGAPAPAGSAPFQFGASTSAAPATSTGFTFGSTAPTTPTATGFGTAPFGAAAGGFGTPTTPSAQPTGFTFGAPAGAPQMQQPQPGLFSMGAAPSGGAAPGQSPGGRQIKPLRPRRR
ncbi:hypothetical protein PSEUBRA_002046 [Kalmanozyma brasiliensis GHG001]|nr:uncharacterized protein PSEUBRA_002046 [Kalmanozyma brasiliensis GHG001]EST08297.2 hypothetical protein PSEUBRA_002046 [Kalmanozyma brasiliensis GHG001]